MLDIHPTWAQNLVSNTNTKQGKQFNTEKIDLSIFTRGIKRNELAHPIPQMYFKLHPNTRIKFNDAWDPLGWFCFFSNANGSHSNAVEAFHLDPLHACLKFFFVYDLTCFLIPGVNRSPTAHSTNNSGLYIELQGIKNRANDREKR